MAAGVRVSMISTHSTVRAQQRGDPPQRAFFAVLALLFTVSTAAAVLRCTSMSAMSEMPMPGAWTDVALRHSVVPWYVAYHDDRDDAAVVNADVAALPPSGLLDGRQALRSI